MNIDAVLKKEEFLNSRNFLKVINSKDAGNIKTVTFIPPRIGKDKVFGQFKIVYKTPYYCAGK